MTSIREMASDLIEELIRAQTPGTFPEKIGGKTLFPSFVAAGNGMSLNLTRHMDLIIRDIASVLKQNNPDLARTYTDNEWLRLVRNSFGSPLANIDLQDEVVKNADLVMDEVRKNLKAIPKPGTNEHTFGCTLFAQDVSPIVIGPVRIESKLEWLERKIEDGGVQRITGRRIKRRWSGDNLRNRRNKIESFIEDDIVKATEGCSYVCSVQTHGLASAAGKQKAQTAARMALTSLALCWETPSSALDGFNLLIDRNVRRQKSLSFVPGKATLSESKLQGRPHGPYVSAVEWANTLTQLQKEFEVVGEIIAFYLSDTGRVARPKLMNALAQAMLWFHEGCREQVDLIAIVKFAATLDALASGKESSGIVKLMQARLGFGPDDIVRNNTQTTKQCVEEIYGKGRSRTIHGTNDKFGHDWSSTRQLSEVLSRHCLVACVSWSAIHLIDDPIQMLI